jgi:hypothetical protein
VPENRNAALSSDKTTLLNFWHPAPGTRHPAPGIWYL